MLAGVDEAERGGWEVGAQGEEGVESGDCGGFGNGDGEGWEGC